MLELYERHSPPADGEIIRNPEAAFLELRVTRSNLTETLMREIDKAEYVNEVLFIDRFGCTIPISRLSTGCKTAIVVEHNPDKIVDLIECGYNARDSIIRNIKSGKVLFRYDDISIDYPGFNDYAIDVLFDGVHFTSLDDLNLYLSQGMLEGSAGGWNKQDLLS